MWPFKWKLYERYFHMVRFIMLYKVRGSNFWGNERKMKPTEQRFPVVFITLYKVVLTFGLCLRPYIHVVQFLFSFMLLLLLSLLFFWLCNRVLTFDSGRKPCGVTTEMKARQCYFLMVKKKRQRNWMKNLRYFLNLILDGTLMRRKNFVSCFSCIVL